ncbi:MAG: PilZ domain-containing protein [Leptonema sp. (in: Bacteria)]|nr:PilZ domain-containing protein [Leptonema sp. (in: bacteria)]
MAEFQSDATIRDPAKQKRRNARIGVNFEAHFKFESDSTVHQASVLDLGTGGIALSAKTPLYPGDRIQLNFALGEQFVEAMCVVSRSSGKTFGVVFEDPEDPVVGIVQDFIQKKLFAR